MKTIPESYWDKSDAANEFFMRTVNFNAYDEPVRCRIVQEALACNSKSVLDVGCATAIDYPLYKEADIQYVGVDFTHRLLESAKKWEATAPVIHADARSLPFATESIDTVYEKDVFEHLLPEDYKKALNEMWRVSKKQVLLAFFGDTTKHTENSYKIATGADEPHYFNRYAKPEVTAEIQKLPNVKQLTIENIQLERTQIPHNRSLYIIKKFTEAKSPNRNQLNNP